MDKFAGIKLANLKDTESHAEYKDSSSLTFIHVDIENTSSDTLKQLHDDHVN